MNLKLKSLIETYRCRFEDRLAYFLPLSSVQPSELHEAMRYSSVDAGKRIRPFLVYATGMALQIEPQVLDYPAVAIELIHNYSLVHDDMPAMDDDELRRGKKTCHLQYNEATALLTGDALQSLAFDVLSQQTNTKPEITLKLVQILSQASGSMGMAGGQAIDLASVGKSLTLSQLQTMHGLKTGALIRASVNMAGALADDKSDEQLDKLDLYAMHLGLAFQIQDDVLDVESDTQTLGKPQGSDAEQNKPTYPKLLGLDNAKSMAIDNTNQAISALDVFDSKADPLRWLADYVVSRQH